MNMCMYEFRRCISVDLVPVCVSFMFRPFQLCACVYTTLDVVFSSNLFTLFLTLLVFCNFIAFNDLTRCAACPCYCCTLAINNIYKCTTLRHGCSVPDWEVP